MQTSKATLRMPVFTMDLEWHFTQLVREDAAMLNFQLAWDLWPGYNEPMNFMGVVYEAWPTSRGLEAYRRATARDA